MGWWYPPDFQTGSESPELGSSLYQSPQPKDLGPGLEYTYWWYTKQGRKAIDRAFFGSVVEFWVHDTIQCWGQGSYGRTIDGWRCVEIEPMFKLEDIRGLGFQVGTVLGASSLFGWSPDIQSFHLDERAADAILEAFRSPNAKKPLPLFHPSTLLRAHESHLWKLPHANLYCLSTLGDHVFYHSGWYNGYHHRRTLCNPSWLALRSLLQLTEEDHNANWDTTKGDAPTSHHTGRKQTQDHRRISRPPLNIDHG